MTFSHKYYKRLMKVIAMIALALSCPSSFAQKTSKHEVAFGGGLATNYTYDLRWSYFYHFNTYLGIGGTMGFYKQWHSNHIPEGDYTSGRWNSWRLSDDDAKIQKLYIEPSLSATTPSLVKIGSWKMRIRAEAGIMLQYPYTQVSVKQLNSLTQEYEIHCKSTHKGKWQFWSVKTMLEFGDEDVFVACGYGLSDFDIYSSYRKFEMNGTRFNQFYPATKLCHSVFVKFGKYF